MKNKLNKASSLAIGVSGSLLIHSFSVAIITGLNNAIPVMLFSTVVGASGVIGSAAIAKKEPHFPSCLIGLAAGIVTAFGLATHEKPPIEPRHTAAIEFCKNSKILNIEHDLCAPKRANNQGKAFMPQPIN